MRKRTKPLDDLVKELTPEMEDEVRDFVEFLLKKRPPKPKAKLDLSWRGALRDLRHKYTSVRLQHKIVEWWGD